MFYQPYTIDEALALKHQLGTDAAFLAGGTDVIVMMNHGRLVAQAYVDLTHLVNFSRVEAVSADATRNAERGLRNTNLGASLPAGDSLSPSPTTDHRPPTTNHQPLATPPPPPTDHRPLTTGYRVDGGVTFSQLAKLPVRCLAEASLGVGGPQIRNRGTIAGNVATASPAGDGSTALLALDATLEFRNTTITRRMPLRDFFLDYRKTALAPDEMITAIEFPGNWRTAWQKLGKRGAMNISMVCCAVGVSPEGKFHIGFGSVGPFPLRAPQTEAYLSQLGLHSGDSTAPLSLSEQQIDEAAKLAAQDVRPIDDFRASADYRRAMSSALLKKCLREIAGRIEPVKFSG